MESVHRIRILLVDDEPHILQFLEFGLRNEGFEVRSAPDGEQAVIVASNFEPHVVVLDVMMPGMDGLEVCRRLKEEGKDVAVIMLTAKDEIDDRVKGLTIGADDYMVKPFSFEELLARIQARLRNQFPSLLGEIRLGSFTIDDRKKEIAYQGEAGAVTYGIQAVEAACDQTRQRSEQIQHFEYCVGL